MISDDKFAEIIVKHMREMMREVQEEGGTSAYQWSQQLANMVVSLFMTITDKSDIPRKDIMDHIVEDFIQWVKEQNEFQVRYDGVSIEDVKKDIQKLK